MIAAFHILHFGYIGFIVVLIISVKNIKIKIKVVTNVFQPEVSI